MTTMKSLNKSFDKMSKIALNVKSERDALLKACIAAYRRLEVLADANEATDNDLEVMGDLAVAIAKAGVQL